MHIAPVNTASIASARALPPGFSFQPTVEPPPVDHLDFSGCFPGSEPPQEPPAPPQQPPQQPPTPPQQPPQEPPTPPAPGAKKWTVMVYSASDNNLYSYMQTDLDEAERVGSTDTMWVLAQTDHGPKKGGVQRLEMQTDQTAGLTSPVKQDLGSANMSDPHQLADFIKWGVENYPAEHYMLIISDHGDGWKGAAQDWSHSGWMSTPMIEAGLHEARESTGKKIDVLGFDACLMASAEVGHQLKDEVNFLVGSEEVEGGAGWAYNRVLSEGTLRGMDHALRTRLNMTPEQMASNVVEAAQGNQGDLPTMSAVDLSKASALTTAVDSFAGAILETSIPNSTLSQTASKTQGFYKYKDLYDFAERMKGVAGEADPALATAAEGVMQAINNYVVAEQHSTRYPNAHGVNIELNRTSGSYGETRFAQDSRWDEAVSKFKG